MSARLGAAKVTAVIHAFRKDSGKKEDGSAHKAEEGRMPCMYS